MRDDGRAKKKLEELRPEAGPPLPQLFIMALYIKISRNMTLHSPYQNSLTCLPEINTLGLEINSSQSLQSKEGLEIVIKNTFKIFLKMGNICKFYEIEKIQRGI